MPTLVNQRGVLFVYSKRTCEGAQLIDLQIFYLQPLSTTKGNM